MDYRENGRGHSDQYPLGFTEVKNIAMVTNPRAGHGVAHFAATKASKVFADRGVNVVALQGSSPEHSRMLMREALDDGRLDALVVCGGDGMINLALQEQAGSDVPLGMIPAGTGNDHAREYNIPRGDAEAAANIIADGFWTSTDLGLITDSEGNKKWFGTIMCSGFDSLVTDRANQMKWPHGKNRYNLAIVREFLAFHSLPFRITIDNGQVLEGPITLASFGNTKTYGGGMQICPVANHSDGLMDVTVIGKAGRMKAAAAFTSIFNGTIDRVKEVTLYRTKKATVEYIGSTRRMTVYADGDYMADLPVTVEIVPAAGKYIVPRP